MSANSYRRLPGRGRTALSRHTLWLGADHLLAVEDFVVKQRYRRFALSDVQLLRVRRTSLHRARVLLLLAALVLAMVLGLLGSTSAVRVSWLLLMVPLGLALGRELWLGATCSTMLYTSVSAARLPSLGRLRSTDQALGAMQGAIERVQGPLVEATRSGGPLASNLAHRTEGDHSADPAPAEPARRHSWWGLLLCVASWVCAGLHTTLLVAGGQALAVAAAVALLTTLVVSVATAATTMHGRLRGAAIAGVAAGVIGMSGVWMMELLGGLRVGYSGDSARVVSSLQLLSSGPVQREPLAWLLLAATLLAAFTAALLSTRGLLEKSP